jgi:hypothetical protein
MMPDPGEGSFDLCLTHDVDRVYKTYQAPYYAVLERRLYHLRALLPGENPYWRFEEVMAIEESLGVRSAFYFLSEKHLFREKPIRSWPRPENWMRYLGRYSLSDPDVSDVVCDLDRGGWEVGLHGSFDSYRDRGRLSEEKETLERVLGHAVLGGRQHHLNIEIPETWRHHAAIGLRYDSTLGSTTGFGFHHGYDPIRPFDDAFVVFPLTVMEQTVPAVSTDPDRAFEACERVLEEARDHGAVMTILWHQRVFSEPDFPGHRELYERIVERALEMGAWVGPPGELYASLSGEEPPRDEVAGVEVGGADSDAESAPP